MKSGRNSISISKFNNQQERLYLREYRAIEQGYYQLKIAYQKKTLQSYQYETYLKNCQSLALLIKAMIENCLQILPNNKIIELFKFIEYMTNDQSIKTKHVLNQLIEIRKKNDQKITVQSNVCEKCSSNLRRSNIQMIKLNLQNQYVSVLDRIMHQAKMQMNSQVFSQEEDRIFFTNLYGRLKRKHEDIQFNNKTIQDLIDKINKEVSQLNILKNIAMEQNYETQGFKQDWIKGIKKQLNQVFQFGFKKRIPSFIEFMFQQFSNILFSHKKQNQKNQSIQVKFDLQIQNQQLKETKEKNIKLNSLVYKLQNQCKWYSEEINKLNENIQGLNKKCSLESETNFDKLRIQRAKIMKLQQIIFKMQRQKQNIINSFQLKTSNYKQIQLIDKINTAGIRRNNKINKPLQNAKNQLTETQKNYPLNNGIDKQKNNNQNLIQLKKKQLRKTKTIIEKNDDIFFQNNNNQIQNNNNKVFQKSSNKLESNESNKQQQNQQYRTIQNKQSYKILDDSNIEKQKIHSSKKINQNNHYQKKSIVKINIKKNTQGVIIKSKSNVNRVKICDQSSQQDYQINDFQQQNYDNKSVYMKRRSINLTNENIHLSYLNSLSQNQLKTNHDLQIKLTENQQIIKKQQNNLKQNQNQEYKQNKYNESENQNQIQQQYQQNCLQDCQQQEQNQYNQSLKNIQNNQNKQIIKINKKQNIKKQFPADSSNSIKNKINSKQKMVLQRQNKYSFIPFSEQINMNNSTDFNLNKHNKILCQHCKKHLNENNRQSTYKQTQFDLEKQKVKLVNYYMRKKIRNSGLLNTMLDKSNLHKRSILIGLNRKSKIIQNRNQNQNQQLNSQNTNNFNQNDQNYSIQQINKPTLAYLYQDILKLCEDFSINQSSLQISKLISIFQKYQIKIISDGIQSLSSTQKQSSFNSRNTSFLLNKNNMKRRNISDLQQFYKTNYNSCTNTPFTQFNKKLSNIKNYRKSVDNQDNSQPYSENKIIQISKNNQNQYKKNNFQMNSTMPQFMKKKTSKNIRGQKINQLQHKNQNVKQIHASNKTKIYNMEGKFNQLQFKIFTQDDLQLFIDKQKAYAYQCSHSKKYHKTIQKLNQFEQNFANIIFQFVQSIKKNNPKFHEQIISFIRHPYQTVNNINFTVPLIQGIKKQDFNKYMEKIIFIHRKCKINKLGIKICGHLQIFKKKIQFLDNLSKKNLQKKKIS